MNNVIYIIFHSPTEIALRLGKTIREDKNKITMIIRNNKYVYIKNTEDVGKFFSNIRTLHRR